MLAKATQCATSESLVDINEANAIELSSILPGIGPVLAERIVSFRAEHGPFQDPRDLAKVPGISAKRFSMVAARVSIAPGTSIVRISAASNSNGPANSGANSAPVSDPDAITTAPRHNDEVDEEAFFAMVPQAFREPPAPSLSSLLGQPTDSVSTMVVAPRCLDSDPEARTPSTAAQADLTSNPFSTEEHRSQQSSEAETAVPIHATQSENETSGGLSASFIDELAAVPLHRSWRVWLVIGTLGLFSTIIGTVIGIRSQAGGPRGALEVRVGRVQTQVGDVAAAVKGLEAQNTGMASSIQALDQRITAQERKDAHARPLALPSAGLRQTPPTSKPLPGVDITAVDRPEAKLSNVQRDVREAIRELETLSARGSGH